MKRFALLLIILAFPVQAQVFDRTIYAPGASMVQNTTTGSTIYRLPSDTADVPNIRAIRVTVTTNSFIAIEASAAVGVEASNDDMFLPSFVPEYFKITPNAQIAVAASDTNGQIYVTEMSQ